MAGLHRNSSQQCSSTKYASSAQMFHGSSVLEKEDISGPERYTPVCICSKRAPTKLPRGIRGSDGPPHRLSTLAMSCC